MLEQPSCVCGCLYDTHLHYRPGSDCGRCGRTACPTYRPAPAQPDSSHRCPRIDELEAEVTELRNLLLFRQFILAKVPPFRPQRARQLRLIAAQATRRHLRVPQPRPVPTMELRVANNRGGRA